MIDITCVINKVKINRVKNQIFILTVLVLNSCSSYNNNFDCKPGIGIGCKSLSYVNKMVNEGKLGDAEESDCINCNSNSLTKNSNDPKLHSDNDVEKIINKDQVIKIWFAPYVENNVQNGEQIIELVKNGTERTNEKNKANI